MTFTKHNLSLNELMLFNSEMKNAEKSAAVAYLMLLGGHLGLHRFYLKRKWSAVLQLLLFAAAVFFYVMMAFGFASGVAGTDTSVFFIVAAVSFGLSAMALFVWIIVDLFLLPGMIRSFNAGIEREILAQIEHYRNMELLSGRSSPGQMQL